MHELKIFLGAGATSINFLQCKGKDHPDNESTGTSTAGKCAKFHCSLQRFGIRSLECVFASSAIKFGAVILVVS